MSSQLEDAFNEAVERRVRMLQATEPVESWSCCGQTFTGSPDFISGARAAHTCPPEDVPDAETAYAMGKAAAASPDERLREALALVYVMLTGAEPMWAEMPLDERCARAANEAQQAFLAADREATDEETT